MIFRRFHCWFSNYVRRNQFYSQFYGPRCSSWAELQLVRAELQPLRVSCSSSRRVAAPIAELHTYARVARCNRRVARAPLSCNLNPELQPHLGQLQEVRFLLCGPLHGPVVVSDQDQATRMILACPQRGMRTTGQSRCELQTKWLRRRLRVALW